jgi:hypothetical protein
MGHKREALDNGARNLLLSCAGAKPGDRLLIFHEDASSTYVEPGLASVVAEAARSLGLTVKLLETPFQPDVDTLSPEQEAAVLASDHTLFLSRLGDQLRFKAMPEGARPIVSHALDLAAFASDFCAAPYTAFNGLKVVFNNLLLRAGTIRVTCALGTDYSGTIENTIWQEPADVTIRRFPMCVFAPIPAARFSGTVAVAHLLAGTGSRYYEPYGLRLGSALHADVENGGIVSWRGDSRQVARVKLHYDRVADLFGINGAAVHSWHAGIHPGCVYAGTAHENYERWTNSAFGNPRLLHFHTCGDYPPGEICWNIVDPTIEVDGVRIWDAGRIVIDAVPGAAAILERFPNVRNLFDRPERRIGLDDDA